MSDSIIGCRTCDKCGNAFSTSNAWGCPKCAKDLGLTSTPKSAEEITSECWCGAINPEFSLLEPCGGSGFAPCHCGGDFCCCHNHGGSECDGCEECDLEEDGL